METQTITEIVIDNKPFTLSVMVIVTDDQLVTVTNIQPITITITDDQLVMVTNIQPITITVTDDQLVTVTNIHPITVTLIGTDTSSS